MALSKLLAGLEAEAAAETARLDRETRNEADRIVEAARGEARALEEQAASDAGERELRLDAERRRARARLETAAALRAAREEAFQGLLAEVSAKLDALRERAGYRAILRVLIGESLAALPGATVLRVDPRDEGLATDIADELAPELRVVPDLATAGGVELSSDDGRTVRNTVEERLANAEPELRLLFAETLSGRAQAKTGSASESGRADGQP
jgi:V/A-type H+/Na+-transporting ATPase subunit E